MADYAKMSDAELNAAVAEKVMGWKLYDYEKGRYAKTKADYVDAYTNDGWGWEGRSGDEYAHQWSPSTDIAAAWGVVEKMKADGWFFQLGDVIELPEWLSRFTSPFFPPGGPVQDASAMDKSAGRSICLAALAAVEAKEKTNA